MVVLKLSQSSVHARCYMLAVGFSQIKAVLVSALVQLLTRTSSPLK